MPEAGPVITGDYTRFACIFFLAAGYVIGVMIVRRFKRDN